MTYWLVFLGGGLGSLLRYALSQFNPPAPLAEIPNGTLWANVLSCLVLGILTGYLCTQSTQNSHARLLIATGFCGGFSTFSTFVSELGQLVTNRANFITVVYLLGSLLGGVAALALGVALGQYFARQIEH